MRRLHDPSGHGCPRRRRAAGTGCRRESAEAARTLGFDAFVPVYNRYIANWLKTQQATTDKEVARIEGELAGAEGTAKDTLADSRRRRCATIRRNGSSASPSGII